MAVVDRIVNFVLRDGSELFSIDMHSPPRVGEYVEGEHVKGVGTKVYRVVNVLHLMDLERCRSWGVDCVVEEVSK